MLPSLQELLIDAFGGVLGGFVGFVFAYLMAHIVRGWDRQDQAAKSRQELLAKVKVPLLRIRDQAESSYGRQAYFNQATEDRVEDQIWSAAYSLGDDQLRVLLEEARRPFHDYAWATNQPHLIDALKPYLDKLIRRVEALGG